MVLVCWIQNWGARHHQQTGVLLFHIIFISLYYTYYDTIIYHYDTIISLIFLQMSKLLFFIISLFQKGLLFHLWHFYYFTYFYQHKLLLLLLLSHYYLHYVCAWLLSQLSFLKSIIRIIGFSKHYHHFCNYGGQNIAIMSIIDIIAIIFISSHLHTKVVYGYTYWV